MHQTKAFFKLEPCLSVILVVILFLTQGCGSASKINKIPTLTDKTVLQPNQGIVVARVINASGTSLPFNELTLTPENINESDKIKWQELQSLKPQLNGSTVFASPIISGKYSLNSISSFFSNGQYWYSRFARADTKFGTFDVKPGKITDLGTIIYYTKPQDDRYIEMLIHMPETDLGEVLNKYFSFYQYNNDNILSWNDDGLSEERHATFLSVAQNPITFKKTYKSPDGSLYFLGKFGILVKRTSFGDWELDAVDTNLDLTAIAENQKGDLIIGGSEGRLFWKPLGKGWQDISIGHNYHIIDLAFNDLNHITMVTKKETELYVLSAVTNSENISWQEINSYNSLDGWKYSNIPANQTVEGKRPKLLRRIFNVSLSNIGKKNYVKVSTKKLYADPVLSPTESKIFSFDDQSWLVSNLENGVEITAAINAGATQLGIKEAGFWSWSDKSTYHRYLNESDSWDEIETQLVRCGDGKFITSDGCNTSASRNKKVNFNFQSVPWFKSELEAIAIVSFSKTDFWSGKRTHKTKIIQTVDGGKTWVDTTNSLPKNYCSDLVTEISDRLLVSCNGASGDFFESTDNGATWEHVRQQENF